VKDQKYQITRKESWKSVRKDFGKCFLEMTLYTNLIPYYIPTFARQMKEPEESRDFSRAETLGAVSGFFAGGLGGIVGQVELYIYLTNKTGFPWWAIPAGASTISGLYELGKWINKKYQD